MSVNSISGDLPAFKLRSLTADLDKPAKSSPANTPSTDAVSEAHKQPVREMSHVVETYNQQGKVLIKFMDSNNNVLYQIPSEMAAIMEDQMTKPETSTNIKG